MNKRHAFTYLPQQCQLRAQVDISDMQLHHGMPEHVIKDQLSRTLGRHLGQKSSTFIKREDPAMSSDPYARFMHYGCTRYTAEVFVFSEEELIAYAERLYHQGMLEATENRVAIEVQLQVGSVKTRLKDSLKKQIDKALD